MIAMQKTIIALLLILGSFSLLHGQNTPVNDTASDQAIPKYLTETPPEHRPGVFKEDGKLFVSDDSRRLLTDADYRAATFPEAYTFEAVPGLLEKGEIQLSLWYLVNLFDENQTLTLQIVADLQKAGIRAEHFVNAFPLLCIC